MAEAGPAVELGELVGSEQARFVALVRELDHADWLRPSWCAGWTVGEVIVHTAAHLHGEQRDKAILSAACRQPHDATLAWLAADPVVPRIPFQSVQRVNRRVQLGELLIHRRDVAGPLGTPADSSRAALVDVLEFGTSRIGNVALTPMRRRARGLRLAATDIDWTGGSGPEVHGPADALIMATSGRPAALASLSGTGVPTLARRVPFLAGPKP